MSSLDYVCDHCSRTFTRKYNLQTHIENCHLNSSCYCEICNQKFGSPGGLQLHLSRGHNRFGQGLPECDLCGRIFTRKQNINSHMITVHLQGGRQDIRCAICYKTFTTERNLKRHTTQLHAPGVEYPTCNECQRSFRGKQSLISHIQTAHSINYKLIKCPLCDKAYSNNRNLKRHVERQHGEKEEFKCEICPKIYTSNQSLRRHAKTQHSKEIFNMDIYTYCHNSNSNENCIESYKFLFSCDLCQMTFESEPNLRQHTKLNHSFQEFYNYCRKTLLKTWRVSQNSNKQRLVYYNCEFCINAFSTVYDLKDHMRSLHDKEYSLSTCNVCFNKFYSKETMYEHKKICLPPENVNSCSHCDKLFTDVSSLEFHIRIFHPQAQIADSNISSSNIDDIDTSYRCLHCDRIYYSERSLKHHMKLKHTTDEAVKCQYCSKICSNKYYLASHIKIVHNNDSWSKCDYCDKQFKSKRNIRRHIEYTHLGMQRYKCIECETLFKEKRSLRKHVRTKHPNSTLFPQCHICEKRFESAKSCKIHLKLLHSFNMNTHPCDLCSVSFTSLEALKIHLATKHLAEDEIYKCKECNLVFKGQEKFDFHNEEFHLNLPTHKTLPRCIICTKDFSTRKTLKRHIKKFHEEFNVDELATYGSRKRVLSIECNECLKNFNDDYHIGVYEKLKNMRDSIIFKCEFCKSSYNSLEFAIQRYRQTFDVSKSKLYLSELCTTEMSDDSQYNDTMEPESTTYDIKAETPLNIKIEPSSP